MAQTEHMIYVYGPPGSGKTTIGQRLAEALALPFIDLDTVITAQAGQSIPDIFSTTGEAGFRAQEAAALENVSQGECAVIALGGGALLTEPCRALAEETGTIVCLSAEIPVLLERALSQAGTRPLLGSASELETCLARLMDARRAHYASFPLQFDASAAPDAIAWDIQVRLGQFHVTGMGKGYDVLIQPGSLNRLGAKLQARHLSGPVALISDENVAPHYAAHAAASLQAAGYAVQTVILPAGEETKNLASLTRLWESFLTGGLERSSTVVALGGGVITDLAGFAAATYLRGVAWVSVPTTLLGMVDASLGGKTAIDLPQGKNLIGSFHPPVLVLADPDTLASLPEPEVRNGLAEVVKHGLLRDPGLFATCARGWEALQTGDWTTLVRRATAVKVYYVKSDPYEKGERAVLNLGHTIGHAIEQASHFQLRHGECVSIGMVAAARLSVRAGLAQPGFIEEIGTALAGLGLPTCLPAGINLADVLPLLKLDKKKSGGQVRFVLPVRVGEARYGIPLNLDLQTLKEVTQ